MITYGRLKESKKDFHGTNQIDHEKVNDSGFIK